MGTRSSQSSHSTPTAHTTVPQSGLLLTPTITPTMGPQMISQGGYNGQAQMYAAQHSTNVAGPASALFTQSDWANKVLQVGELSSRMDGYEYEQDEDHEKILELKKQIQQMYQKMEVLCDVAVRYEQEFQSIGKTLQNMSMKHMQSELKITSLLSKEGEMLLTTCKTFFKEKLGLDKEIDIIVVRRLGDKGPVIVKLAKQEQKKIVFEKVTKESIGPLWRRRI